MKGDRYSSKQEAFHVGNFAARLRAGWPWLFVSVGSFVILAIVFSGISTPIYPVKGSLYVDQEKKPSSGSALKELDYFDLYINIEDEIQVLKSLTILKSVVDSLKLNIEYYTQDNFKKRRVKKPQVPIELHFPAKDSMFNDVEIYINFVDNETFNISLDLKGRAIEIKGAAYGEQLIGGTYKFFISKSQPFDASEWGSGLLIRVSEPFEFTQNLSRQFSINQVSQKSNVLDINFETQDPRLGEQIVNALMNRYLERQLTLKNSYAEKTIKFIDGQIVGVKRALLYAELQLEEFRIKKRIINIDRQSIEVHEKLSLQEKELSSANLQMEYYNYLIKYLDNPAPGAVVNPSTAGITDQVLNNLVVKLNEMSTQLIRLSASTSDINPQMLTLQSQFNSIVASIKENVVSIRNATRIQKDDLTKRIQLTEKDLDQLPGNERQLLSLERQFEMNQDLYTYLLEQKAQAEIAKASNQIASRVIDPASSWPQSYPKPSINIILAVIAGLFFPTLIFIGMELLFPTIDGDGELSEKLDLPVFVRTSVKDLKSKGIPNQKLAESLKKMMLALDLQSGQLGCKTILISSYDFEPIRTVFARSLALLIAETGSKVILIRCESGKGQSTTDSIHRNSIQLPFRNGDSEITRVDFEKEGIDFVSLKCEGDESRSIWTQSFLDDFAVLKQKYQFVIIDVIPLKQSVSAMEIRKQVDVHLFVAVNGKTPYDSIDYLIDPVNRRLLDISGILAGF